MLKCGSNEPYIQIKLILSQKYCMNEIRVIGKFLGSGSLDPNIWVLLSFLNPNIRTLLWWKYIKDVVIMWLSWQTWLTQPSKFNLQLQSPFWNYDPHIKMRLDPKKMVQHQVYIHHEFWCYISESESGSSGPTFWGPMIDTILFVSFSGSNPSRYLVQTWTWTLWYNQSHVTRWE